MQEVGGWWNPKMSRHVMCDLPRSVATCIFLGPGRSRGIAYDPSCIHKIIKCKSLPLENGDARAWWWEVTRESAAVRQSPLAQLHRRDPWLGERRSVCEASILFCDFYHEYWTFIKLGGCGRRVSWLLLLSCWDVWPRWFMHGKFSQPILNDNSRKFLENVSSILKVFIYHFFS